MSLPSLVLGLAPDQWGALSSIGTLGAVLVALYAIFQERFRAWLSHPSLRVTVSTSAPYAQKTLISSGEHTAQCYYFRLKVENAGNLEADGVEILAADLLEEDGQGHFKKSTRFLPMHLVWSHDRRISQHISTGMFRFCDLGHIIDPAERHHFLGEDFIITYASLFFGHEIAEEVVLSLDTEVKPLTTTHLLPAGNYKLKLLVGAKGIKPQRLEVAINLGRSWIVNQDQMLSEGITIEMKRD
jgi:hypothetical protein